jgi:CDP-diacylglycerol--glycerol-3-phosphate 3-phosphatidyltransferase
MDAKMFKRTSIPSAITSLRLIILPFLIFFIYYSDLTVSFALFVFSLLTDLVDGFAARRLHTASRKGAYYDSIADFYVIISVFCVFTIKGLCPYWIPAVLIFSFVLFMTTSVHRTQMYDPVGKYFGGFLYATIVVLMVAPRFNLLINLSIVLFFAACLACRIVYLFFFHQRSETKKE